MQVNPEWTGDEQLCDTWVIHVGHPGSPMSGLVKPAERKPDWGPRTLWCSVRRDELEIIRFRRQSVLIWNLRDRQTVKWLILSVSLFRPPCPAATHTFTHPSTLLPYHTLSTSWVTYSHFLQTSSLSKCLSLWDDVDSGTSDCLLILPSPLHSLCAGLIYHR